MKLPYKTIVTEGPALGLCIALAAPTSPEEPMGYLFPGSGGSRPPAADLHAVVSGSEVTATALTPDGESFLALFTDCAR